jgi:hypothetical protein
MAIVTDDGTAETAMAIARLGSAIDLAELAMEETQFGLLEYKVIKNDIATDAR